MTAEEMLRAVQEHLPSWQVAMTVGASLIIGNFALRHLTSSTAMKTKRKGPKCALDPEEYTKCRLSKVTPVSHNSAIYRFQLPRKVPLNLPIGRHIAIRATVGTRVAVRRYTPVSDPDSLGHLDLLIKTYPSGTISRHVSELAVGDYVEMKGPLGSFDYEPERFKHLGMIAGGTGITPMYQVIKHSLSLPEDKTVISLIYANVNEDDILLRTELETMAKQHPDRFNIHYTLDNPPAGWTNGHGFVSATMIKEFLPAASSTTKILVCGPPPMVASMVQHCQALGHHESLVCRF